MVIVCAMSPGKHKCIAPVWAIQRDVPVYDTANCVSMHTMTSACSCFLKPCLPGHRATASINHFLQSIGCMSCCTLSMAKAMPLCGHKPAMHGNCTSKALFNEVWKESGHSTCGRMGIQITSMDWSWLCYGSFPIATVDIAGCTWVCTFHATLLVCTITCLQCHIYQK